MKENLEGIELYREDTIQPTNTMIVWENYPLCIVEREKLEAAEKIEEAKADQVTAESAVVKKAA